MQTVKTQSFLDRFFHISERHGTLHKEFIGGATTFLTMAYIIFVNPAILTLSGMDKGALITVTCLTSAMGSILMGLCANAPIALAPGMGLNAFFTYSLVLGHGIPWQQALGIVFLSGIFFLVLTISGLRKYIAKAIPPVIIVSAGAGIGLFIALIGLKNMGLVQVNEATLVALGPFTPSVLMAIATLVLMMVLEIKNVRSSLLISITVSTLAGILMGQVQIPKQIISMPPSIIPIAMQLDIMGALKWAFFPAIFSFMFLDFFDSLATILACSKDTGLQNKDGEVKVLPKMLYYDALSTIFGAALGTSTVTAFAESSAGIASGARTGLAAIVTGVLFIFALLFTPLVGMVPSFAISPALVIVGILMFKTLSSLDFSDKKVFMTAFVTTVMMPFTYSISTGLSFGFLTYIITHVVAGEAKKIHPVLWIIAILCVVNFILM